jgi:bacterioferritin
MRKDVDLEQQAIDQYRRHMEQIDDDKIRRLLARIVHDEIEHQKKFRRFAEEFEKEGEPEPEGEGEEVSQRLADIINYGVRHEYTVILQYLYHSFVADDEELKEEMENAAINEMQHMGWLGEELQEKGQQPDFNHEEPFLSRDHVANLKANIAIEDEVTQAYSNQIPELEDEELQEILARIRDHEIYHSDVFRDLLEEAKGRQRQARGEEPETTDESEDEPPSGAPDVPSIGSLRD